MGRLQSENDDCERKKRDEKFTEEEKESIEAKERSKKDKLEEVWTKNRYGNGRWLIITLRRQNINKMKKETEEKVQLDCHDQMCMPIQ